jgi:hypothetical protein
MSVFELLSGSLSTIVGGAILITLMIWGAYLLLGRTVKEVSELEVYNEKAEYKPISDLQIYLSLREELRRDLANYLDENRQQRRSRINLQYRSAVEQHTRRLFATPNPYENKSKKFSWDQITIVPKKSWPKEKYKEIDKALYLSLVMLNLGEETLKAHTFIIMDEVTIGTGPDVDINLVAALGKDTSKELTGLEFARVKPTEWGLLLEEIHHSFKHFDANMESKNGKLETGDRLRFGVYQGYEAFVRVGEAEVIKPISPENQNAED